MSLYKDEPKITNAFKTGIGVDWGELDSGLFEGTERFFRPSYVSNLVSSWIPALENGKVEEKFKQGCKNSGCWLWSCCFYHIDGQGLS